MQEGRKFIRIEHPIGIRYTTIDAPSTKDHVVSRNISQGGVCFVAYERLPKGTHLDLQLEFPFDSVPVFVKGEVVWIKKIGGEQTKAFEVGVLFNKIETNDQKRFKMYIEKEIKST